ncbi:MAG: TasA family protein [Candidatus Levybacteria bacterium]|nr:TasA family protein [Candidatus Levybacteria bacterium]
MNRILLSVLTIALVATVAVGATRAYFTDTEQNLGNTFSTGTIDIAVDGENPWSSENQFNLIDMKPSQVDYANFIIQNVGTNPANVWKKVSITNREDNVISEPECIEGHGVWSDEGCTGGEYTPNNNIDTAIRYDLKVWVYDTDPTENPTAQPVWWQYIYTDDMNKRLNTLDGIDVFLGMVPAGWWMKVEQSYHMDSDTINWAQGDKLTFDITLTAEQLKGVAILENKDFADQDNPTIVYDGIQGTLTYGVKDQTFKGTFTASGLAASTSYSLIHYVDPWPGNGSGSVGLLSSGATDGSGDLSLNFDNELGADMINAKVWLVTSSDYNSGTKSMTDWNQANYLFDTGLIDYYDSDL